MKRLILVIVIAAVVLLSGCASVRNGRFYLLDLDLRTPEQVLAQKEEKTVIYSGSTNKVSMAEGEVRSFPYNLLFKLLEIVKGRLTIFSIEWKTKEGE